MISGWIMTKKNIIICSAIILLIAASIAGIKAYSHYCLDKLRVVDSYAVPEVIRLMEALGEWDFDKIKPFLTERYINSLTAEEWQAEIEKLSVLGELKSFARPGFVSHVPYKKYFICESAAELYTVSSEFENDNAVVKITFDNDCGKLKVATLLIFSPSIKVNPEYFEKIEQQEAKKEVTEMMDDISEEEGEVDLDTLYEYNQEDAPLTELDEVTKKKVEKKLKEPKKKSHGQIYKN